MPLSQDETSSVDGHVSNCIVSIPSPLFVGEPFSLKNSTIFLDFQAFSKVQAKSTQKFTMQIAKIRQN